MNNKVLLTCILLSLFSVSCAASPKPTTLLPDENGWKLVFSDEFNGTKLDTEKWKTCYPWVEADGGYTNAGNNEMQWYQPDEVSVENGLLRLRAEKASVKNGFPYTSGMVTTHEKFSFQNGYVEARIEAPTGQGLWPALWMLPEEVKWPPEIDILEVIGHQPSTAHTTLHYTTDGSNHFSQGSSYTSPDFSAAFHIFGLLWEPNIIIWYIDGVERFAVEREGKNIPQEPFYLLANLAVGGNWPGAPNETTAFPAYFDIDYIRVFANASYMATAAAPTNTPTGGKSIVRVAVIRPTNKDGKETTTFTPGLVTWKVQVVNQDGQPIRDASISMTIVSDSGDFNQRLFSWDKSDRNGWGSFSISLTASGIYTLTIEKIYSIHEYNPQADTKSVKITVK